MPELPEVETVKEGLKAPLIGQTIFKVTLYRKDLRWPIPEHLPAQLHAQTLCNIKRRGKYLLFEFNTFTMLIHLGMSGYLRIAKFNEPLLKHDHVTFSFDKSTLIFNDSRRFGSILLADKPAAYHPLIKNLGPEPISDDFNADYLFIRTQKRSVAIKSLIMNANIVVGIGNIYANEALFHAHIHPFSAAKALDQERCTLLADEIKKVIHHAIAMGGTTLKDFKNAQGKPGYFKQALQVYGRENEPCPLCHTLIKRENLSGRSTFYCSECQH